MTAVPRSDLIDAIFSRYGIRDAWEPVPSTGIANWIYGTHDVVLRVATDHRDGVPDARTESVAAPAAHAAGILTPRMIAFDDTRAIVDRPFSLWERVHAGTLGLIDLPGEARLAAWSAVGRELARLHRRVTACPDPQGYLDTPGDEPDAAQLLAALVADGRVDAQSAADIEAACRELGTAAPAERVLFTHGDVHMMNVMCDERGQLRALIDWGDAGWSDPMHDFSSMPLDMIPAAVLGYEAETGERLGPDSLARLIRTKALSALDYFARHPGGTLDGAALRRFATQRGGPAS